MSKNPHSAQEVSAPASKTPPQSPSQHQSQHQGETLSGAQIIVRLLERQGIRLVAGMPGGPILPLYDALFASTHIRPIMARHEQGGGFIAQGMARVSGEVAVCIASSGPGATNLMTAIADARLDSIPLVAITGQVPINLIGTDAFQEVDTYGMSLPITKHNFLVASAHELLDVIPQAFSIAASGRPGPVLIDVPKNVQTEIITVSQWPAVGGKISATAGATKNNAAIPLTRIHEAAAMINTAERPVLYLGGGIVHSGAATLAVSLAEKSNLPTVMTLMALGTMPVDHPLSLGMLGMHGERATNFVLDECDLLIALGARFDDRATGKVAAFCPQAKIIHIDIDPAELNKIKAAHLGLSGDVGEALAQLLPLVAQSPRRAWQARVSELRSTHPPVRPGIGDLATPYGLIDAVAAALDDEAIITTDVGQHQMWVAQAYPLRRPRQWLTSGGLGTMGFGVPAAIGAALAEPKRTVICFSGDGSVLLNCQEFATAAEENLNIKVILIDNAALGLVVQQQNLFYGQRLASSQFKGQPNFCALAESFGWSSLDLQRAENPRAALHEALHRQGPCLIHARIAQHEQVLPMVAPGAANTDMIGA